MQLKIQTEYRRNVFNYTSYTKKVNYFLYNWFLKFLFITLILESKFYIQPLKDVNMKYGHLKALKRQTNHFKRNVMGKC